MAIRTLDYLKARFEAGDQPSQADFSDLIDSCYNGLTALSGSDANLLLSYVTNFNYFDTVLAILTANSFVGTSSQNPLYTSTNLSLTADQINVNLNELEALVYTSNTLLNVLTGQQTTINLDVSAINVNTDQVENLVNTTNTLLNNLTSVDYSTSTKQNVTNSLLTGLTAVDYATSNKQNALITRLSTLTGVSYATSTKQDLIITLLNALTANTDSLEINTDDVETLITRSNALLNTLTGQQTTVNLDVSAININTDQVENLITRSNTLLNNLTAVDYATSARQSTTNTLLNTLTAVDYSTSARQNITNSLLTGLTGQANTLFTSVCGTNSRLQTLVNQTDTIESNLSNIRDFTVFSYFTHYTTTDLSSSIEIGYDKWIVSITGMSLANTNQYLQIFDRDSSTLILSQIIKPFENFNFTFPYGSTYLVDGIIRNSLTPIIHTQAENNMFLSVRVKNN